MGDFSNQHPLALLCVSSTHRPRKSFEKKAMAAEKFASILKLKDSRRLKNRTVAEARRESDKASVQRQVE